MKKKQVSFFLTWAAFLLAGGYGPDKAVWLNIDETALPLHTGGRHGNVLGLHTSRGKRFSTRASLHERRAHVTLVASVCTSLELQSKLPQFLLPNVTGKKRVWQQAMGEIAGEPPIVVLPDTQGWVNTAKLQKILSHIGKVCKKEAPGKRIVLVWDCCPAHLAPAVLQHARTCGIRPLMIPGKLTHVLQVLDFAVFARFKKQFHDSQMESLLQSVNGTQELIDWIRNTVRIVRDTFRTCNVAEHFHRAGQGANGVPWRQLVTEMLQSSTWRPVPRRITQEEFWYMIGRKQKLAHRILFGATPESPAPAHVAPAHPPRRLNSKTTL